MKNKNYTRTTHIIVSLILLTVMDKTINWVMIIRNFIHVPYPILISCCVIELCNVWPNKPKANNKKFLVFIIV